MSISEFNEPVASNIKRLVAQSDLKRRAIAERLGCTTQELCDMAHGRRVIKVSDIPKLCTALNCDISDLFRNEEAVRHSSYTNIEQGCRRPSVETAK